MASHPPQSSTLALLSRAGRSLALVGLAMTSLLGGCVSDPTPHPWHEPNGPPVSGFDDVGPDRGSDTDDMASGWEDGQSTPDNDNCPPSGDTYGDVGPDTCGSPAEAGDATGSDTCGATTGDVGIDACGREDTGAPTDQGAETRPDTGSAGR